MSKILAQQPHALAAQRRLRSCTPFHVGLNCDPELGMNNVVPMQYAPTLDGALPAPGAGWQYRIEIIEFSAVDVCGLDILSGYRGAKVLEINHQAGHHVVRLGTHADKTRSGLGIGEDREIRLSDGSNMTRVDIFGYRVPFVEDVS